MVVDERQVVLDVNNNIKRIGGRMLIKVLR